MARRKPLLMGASADRRVDLVRGIPWPPPSHPPTPTLWPHCRPFRCLPMINPVPLKCRNPGIVSRRFRWLRTMRTRLPSSSAPRGSLDARPLVAAPLKRPCLIRIGTISSATQRHRRNSGGGAHRGVTAGLLYARQLLRTKRCLMSRQRRTIAHRPLRHSHHPRSTAPPRSSPSWPREDALLLFGRVY
jgi:hypothetical protein